MNYARLPTDESLPPDPVWEARDTTVTAVEQQLDRILHEMARPVAGGVDESGASHPPPRASVLNLVVHADEEGEAEQAAALMTALAHRHPSRTLLLIPAPNAPSTGLDASIRTHSGTRSSGVGSYCVQQVQFHVRGASALHLASVVEPLLISNLPCFLWWLGRPPASSEPLLSACDRLIVDSADFPDALTGLAGLVACAATGGDAPLDLGDLGWRRIAAWCQLVAQFFDPHDARAYQRQVRRVLVEYASPTATLGAAPLLLVGWLASRLEWVPQTTTSARGAIDVLLVAPWQPAGRWGQDVVVQIRPVRSSPNAQGTLVGVTLTAQGREGEASFALRAAENAGSVHSRAVLPGLREVAGTSPLGAVNTLELLAEELERAVADPVYADTLAMVGRLVH